jgi:hypothetical protein
MKNGCENTDRLVSKDSKKIIKLGDRVRVLEYSGTLTRPVIFPYEGIVTELVEEWDAPRINYLHEDWGPNMIYIDGDICICEWHNNFDNIEVL